ncbi:MAG: ribosomal-processing cysteine protease Prp [Clostridiales bacterium]|nr:ribosomal-processing cysteine protease Prp [Clostridiales bacterium]
MIRVTVYRHHDRPVGFRCNGHAGFAEAGKDVVCAGVSAIAINAVNSISALTGDKYKLDSRDDGYIDFRINGEMSHDAELLLESMVLGVQGIQGDYGDKFVSVSFKEV